METILNTDEVINTIKDIYRYTMLNRNDKILEDENILYYGIVGGSENKLIGQGRHKECYRPNGNNSTLPTIEPNEETIHRWLDDSEEGNYISLDGRKIFESIGNNQWIKADEIHV